MVVPHAAILAVAAQTWSTAGDQAPSGWMAVAGLVGAAAMALVFLLAVVRAVARQARYRAVRSFGEADAEAVRQAVVEAERRTVGEILPVVVERSDPHPGAPWIAALFTLSTGSVLLAAYLPWDLPGLFLACQLGLGALGWIAARLLPDFLRWFVSEDRATRVAAEQAFQEFYANGLHRTDAATGVLLFVSLLERRAIVLGDTGIDAVLEPEDWERTTRAVLDGLRAGSLRDGLVRGVETAGELLATHFPWTEGDRDELPNRLLVRRE